MNPRFSAATNGVDSEAAEQSKLARVLDNYLAAVEAGEAVDPESLALANPEIADRLRACLSVLRVASQVEARADADAAIEPAVDTRLGDFQILRMIGRGAMGIVFEAEQVSLRRRVALKVLPFASALDPHPLRRFQIEAQAAAQLHHTNIVPIFSVGCERGVHYYAMQYIEGQTVAALIHDLRRFSGSGGPSAVEAAVAGMSLAEEVASGRLDPAPARVAGRGSPDPAPPSNGGRRSGEPMPSTPHDSTRKPSYFRTVAHLGLRAAEALDHAHHLGIIHRDIKPANLLVDVRGNLWVTDFGLARMQSDCGLTMTGDVIGTLRYMSPEQSAARRGIVDHRADVYSLGATLYELLTLRPPHDGRDRGELLNQMAFGEPKAPRTHNPAIPRDLETIVLKAIAREPEARYATAQDLASDLRRFLDQRPIQARRPSLWRRAEKWARRHRTLVACSIAIVAITVSAAAIIAVQTRNNRRLDRNARHAQYVQDVRQAFQLVRRNELREAVRVLDRYRPAPGEEDERSFPWYYLWRLCHFQPRTFLGHEGDVYHVEFSPDGRALASCGQDGTVRLWDPATGRLPKVLRGHDGDINYVAFSPDGRLLATGGDDGTVRLWDVASGEYRSTLGKHEGWVTCVLFTPDGRRLISGAKDKRVKVWEIATGREQAAPSPDLEIEGMALSPDGRTLSVSGWGRYVHLWDLASRDKTRSLDVETRTQSVAFSHDGRLVGTGGFDGIVRLWDTEKGLVKATLRGHTGQVECVAFSPDDRIVASSANDGTIRMWDVASGRPRDVHQGHDVTRSNNGRVWCVAFSPDGRTLASCGRDARVNLWDLSASQDRIPIGIPGRSIQSVALLPGRSRAMSFSLDGPDGIVAEIDTERGELLNTRRIHAPSPLLDGVLSSDGRKLAAVSVDGAVTLYDARSGRPRKNATFAVIRDSHPDGGDKSLRKMTFSTGGRFLAITGLRKGVFIWETESDRERYYPRFDYATIGFLPGDERTLVLHSGGLALGDLATGDYQPSHWTEPECVTCMSLSADGRKMAAGGGDGTIKLWDARSLELEATLFAHGEEVTSLDWSPDGKVLASHSQREGVRLWDVATRQELGALVESAHHETRVMFSSDGSILATIGAEPFPQVVLWPAPRDETPSR